jgi:trehalose synthase
MTGIQVVPVPSLSPTRFATVLNAVLYERFQQSVAAAKRAFGDRTIWNVNSTARGGGVAEMLRSLIGYVNGAGLDARWLAIPGDAEFFRVTKRIHNHLHGFPGDGGSLDDAAREVYERALAPTAVELAAMVRPGDLVILHDPQPAGLAAAVGRAGAIVVWRCHVGLDTQSELAHGAWQFLLPYVSEAAACVFSRRSFVWDVLDPRRIVIIEPSIDAFSPKNVDLAPGQVRARLVAAGVVRPGPGRAETARFTRLDGRRASIRRRVQSFESAPAGLDDRLVVQVSRWDRLKDPLGVMRGFAEYVAPSEDAHLVLAGPAVAAVTDDPEGATALRETVDAWRELPGATRERIHLVTLPMEDLEENAAIVNAIQHHATIVVQKSLAEGFGLTVAEAMWKGRPVIASKVGGIQEQILDGRTGVLLEDPYDLAAFGDAVSRLLNDPDRAARIGAAARAEVRDQFLAPRHLMQYADLFVRLVGASPPSAGESMSI